MPPGTVRYFAIAWLLYFLPLLPLPGILSKLLIKCLMVKYGLLSQSSHTHTGYCIMALVLRGATRNHKRFSLIETMADNKADDQALCLSCLLITGVFPQKLR